ncbi:choice-of-anchor D domain-containing protein, partial [bacterium]|nr:choice-of-anchor D domain-containing protein [bacterium]
MNQAINIANTVITSADFQDSLDVTATSSNGKLTVGTVGNILAGANADLTVTAATAGNLAANVALTLTSNANGLAGLSNESLAGQTVAVTGVAYDYAKAVLASNTLSLGNVRTGTAATLAVTNEVITAASFQDGLLVAASADNGKLTLTNPDKIAAGLSGNVKVKAIAAGSLAATVSLTLDSDANGVSGLQGKSLAAQSFTVIGTAYDLAQVVVTNRTLDFGNVRKGGAAVDQTLAIGNSPVSNATYQDDLLVAAVAGNGKLTATGATIAANASGNLTVAASTASAGSLADTVTLTMTSKATAAGLG